MQDIATGEYAFYARLETFIYDWTRGDRLHVYADAVLDFCR